MGNRSYQLSGKRYAYPRLAIPFLRSCRGRGPDLGMCSDVPAEPPWHPATNRRVLASCLRYRTRLFPPSAHTLPKSRARGSLPTQPAPYLAPQGREKRKGTGERSVCSVATSGCPKRSEDGFPVGARNMPPRPVQNKSPATESGALRAADGNRTRVSGLGSVRSTIELQPHPLQSSVYRAGS